MPSRNCRLVIVAALICLPTCCARFACSGVAWAQELSGLQAAVALEASLVDAIAKAERSVVAIARTRKPTDASPAADLLEGLGESGELLGDPTRPDFVPHDFGSGVVVDSRGLILTTYHVVGDVAASRYVVWIGKKPYPAVVKAADPWLDLAILKIEASDLTPVPFGDARSIKKGQIAIALGNPYAIARDGQPSATWGIIANLARPAPPALEKPGASAAESRTTLHHYGNLIQTDARLELGSSGGALVNLKGELIGITTSLAALAGYEKSGGFAIPVDDDFRRSLETLKSGRVPAYGFLGVAPTFLTAEERRQGRFGARLLDVVPATPAAKSGLQAGDVITHVEGEAISDDLELIRRLSGLAADTTVTLTLERGGGGANRRGRVMTPKVTLSKKRVEGPRPAYSEQPDPAWRGMRVEYATAMAQFRDQSRELDADGSLGVVDVEKDSPAWKAGFRPGDFVSHVGKSRVATPKQFQQATAEVRGSVTFKLTGLVTGATTRTVQAVE